MDVIETERQKNYPERTKQISKSTISKRIRQPATVSSNNNNNNNHPNENELINRGLQKLISQIPSKIGSKHSRPTSKLTTRALPRESSLIIQQPNEISGDAKCVRSGNEIEEEVTIEEINQNMCDMCTMTDFSDTIEVIGDRLNLENAVHKSSYRDYQLADPRLLNKYAFVECTKSITIPLADRGDFGNHLLHELSDDEFEINATKHVVIKAGVTVVAGCISIGVISWLMAKFVNEEILDIFLAKKEPEFFLKLYAKYLGGAIVHVFNFAFDVIIRLLTLRKYKRSVGKGDMKSTYATNLLETGHKCDNTPKILHICNKGLKLNLLEQIDK